MYLPASCHHGCFVTTRNRPYLFLVKAEHRRYTFAIRNKFFLRKTTRTHNFFLLLYFFSVTPCPGAPSGLWAMSTHLHTIPVIGNTQYWVFCATWEKGPETICQFSTSDSDVWLLHRWNRSLAKTPVCFLSQ